MESESPPIFINGALIALHPHSWKGRRGAFAAVLSRPEMKVPAQIQALEPQFTDPHILRNSIAYGELFAGEGIEPKWMRCALLSVRGPSGALRPIPNTLWEGEASEHRNYGSFEVGRRTRESFCALSCGVKCAAHSSGWRLSGGEYKRCPVLDLAHACGRDDARHLLSDTVHGF